MRKKIYLAFGVFVVIIAAITFVNREYNKTPSYLSGDEPHYIMLTDNLVHYGNFDLKLSNRDHRSQSYYPWAPLEPHKSPIFTNNSRTGILSYYWPTATYGRSVRTWWRYGRKNFYDSLQLALIPLFYLIVRRFIKSGKRQLFAMAFAHFLIRYTGKMSVP